MLAHIEAFDLISTNGVQEYVESMQQPKGGFRGFEFDPADDVVVRQVYPLAVPDQLKLERRVAEKAPANERET